MIVKGKYGKRLTALRTPQFRLRSFYIKGLFTAAGDLL